MKSSSANLPLRVLVVDDDADTTATTVLLLQVWGHEARAARDGPAALEATRAFRPDVILLDVGLPGLNGYEVASQIRTSLSLGAVLLICISGYGTAEDRKRALAAGCDQFLIKPADPEELHRLLAARQALLPVGADAASEDESVPPADAAASTSTLLAPTSSEQPVEIRVHAERCLRGHASLANLSCDNHEGVLILRGCVPTYGLKQLAETVVAGIKGVVNIRNEIEIVSSMQAVQRNQPYLAQVFFLVQQAVCAMNEASFPPGLRVLIVDDNILAARTLEMLVRQWGHVARMAHDGPAALEVARDFHPHLVLLDIDLPGMDGWQVAAAMRKQPCTRTALLLAVSILGQEGDVQHSLEAGLHGHMTKPADLAQLKELVDRLANAQPMGQ